MDSRKPILLPSCHREAENLHIIFACSGAASVGEIGHQVGVLLTETNHDARLCCTTAIASGSEMHLEIGRRAKSVIVINGCPMKCATKVMEKAGIKVDYEFTITEMGIKKQPTLDITEEEVLKIALEIARRIGMNLDLRNIKAPQIE